MRLYASLLPMILMAAWPSCDSASKQDTETVPEETHTSEATLRWTGMLAADGCGYFITINGTEYKPVNDDQIPERYNLEQTSRVLLTYQLLDEPQEYSCGLQGTRFESNLRVIDVKPLP